MASAVIGALRVVLGMNAGEFTKGAKKAGDTLSRLADRAKKLGLAMAAAMAAAGAAIAVAVKGALKDFDKLTKTARSIGVPVEELSKLQHAAELSGTSVEGLGKAFKNVADNMRQAAKGPTDFSRTLDALGVAWQDSEGNFRRADELMLDVADRFKGMEDGAGKTATAIALFGKKAGPELISMLNAGGDGIRQMTAEAEQLGLAFDTAAGEAAERFNDQMDRLGKVGAGFTTQLTKHLLPTLEKIINRFYEWATSGEGVKNLAYSLASAFNSVVDVALRTVHAIDAIWARTKLLADNVSGIFSETMAERQARIKAVNAGIEADHRRLEGSLSRLWTDFEAKAQGWGAVTEGPGGAGSGGGDEKPPVVRGIEQQNEALELLNQAERERMQIMKDMQSPYDAMIERQTRLNELFGASAEHAGILAKANQMAAAAMHNAYASAASKVSGALAQMFNQSKGVAIANALINTYEAVSAALKNPPGPPFSYAYAAAALASGMAQVNAIRSTNKGGSGGGAATAAAPVAAAPAQQPQQMMTVNLHGTSFGRDQVRGLIESINDAISDGAQLIVRAA